MPDLFDFGGNPIEDDRPAVRDPEWIVPAPKTAPAPSPAPAPAEPCERPGLVASFACLCGCQAEILEPAPDEIRCWGEGCGLAMYRWRPCAEPPVYSARALDPASLIS